MYDLPVRQIAAPSELEFTWVPRDDGVTLSFSTASVESGALAAGAWYSAVCAGNPCNVAYQPDGESITADNTCHRLPVGETSRPFQVRAAGAKIVCVGDDAGTLFLSKLRADVRA